MRREAVAILCLSAVVCLTGLTAVGTSFAAAPEIAFVYPEYAGSHLDLKVPQTMVGEGLDSPGLEVWTFTPKDEEEAVLKAVVDTAAIRQSMPAVPPKEARKISPLIFEKQVLLADLGVASLVWLKNADGFSAPYLINAAQPKWLNERTLQQGQLLRIYGLGLKKVYSPTRVALVRNGKARILEPQKAPFYVGQNETRLLELMIPEDMDPGDYRVYTHNGLGGVYGWGDAGELRVETRRKPQEKIFNVRRYGAVGDGQTNDTGAVRKALAAAAQTGNAVVFLPPGTYNVDESLRIPSGVILRGAGRQNTIIMGTGYDPAAAGGQFRWSSALASPASVLLMENRTGIEHLGVQGAVGRGAGGVSLVQAIPSVASYTFPAAPAMERLTLRNVHLHAEHYHPDYGSSGSRIYAFAFSAGETFVAQEVRHLHISDSLVTGGTPGIHLGRSLRADIVGNTIHGGAISANGLFDCFIDRNVMRESPTRFFTYRPVRNTYFRSNEMYNFGTRGTAGANEAFMLHGGNDGLYGVATSAGAASLTDSKAQWEPGQFRKAYQTLLITEGRGFGQYREIVDNTGDTILIDRPWSVTPDAGSRYAVRSFFVDTAYFDNYLDGRGFFMLYWDNLNVMVEQQRDHFAGGIDIRASERPGFWSPTWYTMMLNNQMDMSRLRYFIDEMDADVVCPAPVHFANYLVGNNIVDPVHRQAMTANMPRAGIDFEAGRGHKPAGRTLWTVIAGNTVSGCDVGVRVPEWARRTFVLNNTFIDVKRPVLDFGSGSVGFGNRLAAYDESGGNQVAAYAVSGNKAASTPIPDYRRDDPLAGRQVSMANLKPGERGGPALPFMQEAAGLRRLVPGFTYIRLDVQSQEKAEECRRNLRQLFTLISAYEKKQGFLPKAAFYPRLPLSDADSIAVILGKDAKGLLRCPSAGPEFDQLGWPGYIWNAEWSGRKLADVKAPGETWLLMDFSIPQNWLVKSGFAGHHGGVNVLYADGTVKWLSADEAKTRFYFSN